MGRSNVVTAAWMSGDESDQPGSEEDGGMIRKDRVLEHRKWSL